MAKKKNEEISEKKVVWSRKYNCYITAENAYYDEFELDWRNKGIEEVWHKHNENNLVESGS